MKDTLENFYTPQDVIDHRAQYEDLNGPQGWLLFVSCDAAKGLAGSVKREYEGLLSQIHPKKKVEIPLMDEVTRRFERYGKDGTCPRLSHHVGGANAYVFQNCMDKREDQSHRKKTSYV